MNGKIAASPRTCQYPGCNAPIIRGGNRRKYCDPCKEIVEREHRQKNNARQIEERRKAWEAKPLPCKAEGCSNQRLKPRDHFCPSCRAEAKKREMKAKVQRIAEDKPAKPEPWQPRPRPKPIMTDAQQRAHDIQLEQRLNERCGYGHGKVKRLTAAEIAEVAKTLVPPVRSGAVLPYMGER